MLFFILLHPPVCRGSSPAMPGATAYVILEEPKWHCNKCQPEKTTTMSRQPKQDQRQRRGCRLHIKNSPADGGGAIDAGDDHAEQEERLDLQRKRRSALQQAPGQARGEEAVIEPLIGGQHCGIGGLLGRV